MAQNILTCDIDDLVKALPNLSLETLKQLIEAINENCQGNIAEFLVCDLKRKETKILKEMYRRGIWNEQTDWQIKHWLKGLKYKKKFF